jgi:hypothetical protein
LLLLGGQALADFGFNVQDAIGLYFVEVNIPPFTKGKKWLHKINVDFARNCPGSTSRSKEL